MILVDFRADAADHMESQRFSCVPDLEFLRGYA